jgi:hypothetical protein
VQFAVASLPRTTSLAARAARSRDLVSLNPQPLPPKEVSANVKTGFSALSAWQETGKAQIQGANQTKAELSLKVKQTQGDLEALERQLDENNDGSGFESFLDGLFGADGGAGEVGDAVARVGAEVKKAQPETQVKQSDEALQERDSTSRYKRRKP